MEETNSNECGAERPYFKSQRLAPAHNFTSQKCALSPLPMKIIAMFDWLTRNIGAKSENEADENHKMELVSRLSREQWRNNVKAEKRSLFSLPGS